MPLCFQHDWIAFDLVGKFLIMENKIEIWKDIPQFEGKYQVSNLGNLKTIGRYSHAKNSKRWVQEGIKNQVKDKDGYHFVSLSEGYKKKCLRIHRLVAIMFIDNVENKPHVNHINGNKSDNKVDNLEWVTSSENNYHYHRVLRTRRHLPYRKITDEKILEI